MTDTPVEKVTEKASGNKLGAGIIKRSNLNFVAVNRIARREGWNPRHDFGEIAELAKSITANGILNPIRVKRLFPSTADADFELIDGDRRLTAIEQIVSKSMKNGNDNPFMEGIPAIIVDRSQEDVRSLIQMFESNTGKQFLPLEEAAAYTRMVDAGMSVTEISKAVSRSTVQIYDMLDLMKADASVKDAVADGTISKSQAKKIAHHAKGDKKKQSEIVAAAKTASAGTGAKANKAKAKAIDKAVLAARKAKAAAKGKVVKMRALSDADLSEIGTRVSRQLLNSMKDANKEPDFNIREWVADNNDLVLAFTFGALEALKAAAGQKVELIL